MAIFERKPWVNPFEKMSIFPLFEHLNCFYSLEKRFLFWNIVKEIVLAYIVQKKEIGKNGHF